MNDQLNESTAIKPDDAIQVGELEGLLFAVLALHKLIFSPIYK